MDSHKRSAGDTDHMDTKMQRFNSNIKAVRAREEGSRQSFSIHDTLSRQSIMMQMCVEPLRMGGMIVERRDTGIELTWPNHPGRVLLSWDEMLITAPGNTVMRCIDWCVSKFEHLDTVTFSHYDAETNSSVSTQRVFSNVTTGNPAEWLALFQQPVTEIVTSVFRHTIFLSRLNARGFQTDVSDFYIDNDDLEHMEVVVSVSKQSRLQMVFYYDHPHTVVEMFPTPTLRIDNAEEMLRIIKADVFEKQSPRPRCAVEMLHPTQQPNKQWFVATRFQQNTDLDALLEIISIVKQRVP